MIVDPSPAVGLDLGHFQGWEQLGVEAFPSEGRDQTLGRAVLPRLAWIDEGLGNVVTRRPSVDSEGDILASVIAADGGRVAVHLGDALQLSLDVDTFPGSTRRTGQTESGRLVLDQQEERLATFGTIFGKVRAPHRIRGLGNRIEALSRPQVLAPLATAHLEFLGLPEPMQPVAADRNALLGQHAPNDVAAPRGMVGNHASNHLHQRRSPYRKHVPVRQHRTRHAKQEAGATLRDPAGAGESGGRKALRNAHHFFALISFITSISRSRSAKIFLSRAFSCSRRFKSVTWFLSMPPKRLRQLYSVGSVIPCLRATSATEELSLSWTMATICSSVNRDFFIPAPFRVPQTQVMLGPRNRGRSEQVWRIISAFRGANKPAIKSKYNPKIIQFSDSIIRAQRIDSKWNIEHPSSILFSELISLIFSQIELIGQGVLVRGGMSLGRLAISEGNVFGPAMVAAYNLESKFAVYPRIVIDPKIISDAKTNRLLWKHGHSAEHEFASYKKLITCDSDGIWFIDYLKASSHELLNSHEDSLQFFGDHKNLIINAAKNFNELSSESAKLLWLSAYHNRTVHNCKEFLCTKTKKDYLKFLISEAELPLAKSLEL